MRWYRSICLLNLFCSKYSSTPTHHDELHTKSYGTLKFETKTLISVSNTMIYLCLNLSYFRMYLQLMYKLLILRVTSPTDSISVFRMTVREIWLL